MMGMTVTIGRRSFAVDVNNPIDLSLSLRAQGERLRVFGMAAPSMRAVIPPVAAGGAVNCEEWTIIPHCHGTHTESVGHITRARIPVITILHDTFIPATVVTVIPQAARAQGEAYSPALNPDDMVITRKDVEEAVTQSDPDFLQALIIRTMPNGIGKVTRDYDMHAPVFFSNAAMAFIAALDVHHLLVDMPSVDRLQDDGLLSNHHIYWDVPQGTHDVSPDSASRRTITELIYVPDAVDDGSYLLNLQVAALESDSAPSRPILYKVE